MENALSVFSKAVSRLRIPRELPVAVAVSGGCDSMVLTLMAIRLFNRVVGLTVDHKLREDSTDEANRVQQLVSRLGAEAHTLTLNWGSEGKPPSGKLQVMAREKRYSALLEWCSELGLETLMVGHHMDDQSESFLYRLAMGSGIDGLGGMYPVSSWPGYPRIKIVRPLLELHKCDLVRVCRSEGVEWVEDPTNQTTQYMRNHYRKLLENNPHLVGGVEQLVRSCDQARTVVNKQVHSEVFSLTSVNTKYGYVAVDLKKLRPLPSPIVKRILSSLIRYISGSEHAVSFKILDSVCKSLSSYNGKNMSAGRTVITQLSDGVVGICKTYPGSQRGPTPIRPGETILWESRWEVTLKRESSKSGHLRAKPKSKGQIERSKEKSNDVYYVRNMMKKDWSLAVRGVRAVRKASLPPTLVRPSLPVIVDDSGTVVLIPHFQFSERMVGISAVARFKPKLSLEDILVNTQNN